MSFEPNVDFSTLLVQYLLPRGREENLDSTSGPNELIEDIKAKKKHYTKVLALLKPFQEKNIVRIKQTLKSVYGQDLDRVESLAGRKGIKPQRLPSVLAPIIYDMMPRLERSVEEMSVPELMSLFVKKKDAATGERLRQMVTNRSGNILEEVSRANLSSSELIESFYSISPEPLSPKLEDYENASQIQERLDVLNGKVNLKTVLGIFVYVDTSGNRQRKVAFLPESEMRKGNTKQYSVAGIEDAATSPRYLKVYYPKLWWLLKGEMVGKRPTTYEEPITLKVDTPEEESSQDLGTYTISDSDQRYYQYTRMLAGVGTTRKAGKTKTQRMFMLPKIPGRMNTRIGRKQGGQRNVLVNSLGNQINISPVVVEILKRPSYLTELTRGAGLSQSQIQSLFPEAGGVNLEARAIRVNERDADDVLDLLKEEKVDFLSDREGGALYVFFKTEDLGRIAEIKQAIIKDNGADAIESIETTLRSSKFADERNFRTVDDPESTFDDHLHSLVLIGIAYDPALRDKLKEGKTNPRFFSALEKAVTTFIETFKQAIDTKLQDILDNPEVYKKQVDEDIFNILARYDILVRSDES